MFVLEADAVVALIEPPLPRLWIRSLRVLSELLGRPVGVSRPKPPLVAVEEWGRTTPIRPLV